MRNKIKKSLGPSVRAGILIAFGELFLKSAGVQKIFKKRLKQNIIFYLKKSAIDYKFVTCYERFFIATAQERKAMRVLKRIFGIAWFSPAFFLEKAELKEVCSFLSENYQQWLKKKDSFAIRLAKSNEIRYSSRKIIDCLAEKIDRKVDLSWPQKEIFVEARKQGWFIYFKKNRGAGGLPCQTAGRVLTLVSGGLDSPVSAYLMSKRGAENIWLHFHSFPLTSESSIEKVKELAQVFVNFQPGLKIYFFPFAGIQTEIKTKILAKYRILLYRRTMLKIARQIAKKEKCLALVSGESLGQVSSQTLPNMRITDEAADNLILRPLIALDKQEIIKLAKKIKTFDISIKPQEDCCTLFTPKHATARAEMEQIKWLERQLDLKKLIRQSFRATEITKY